MLLGAILLAFGCFVYAVLMQREAMVHRATLDAVQGQLAVLEETLERISAKRENRQSVPGVSASRPEAPPPAFPPTTEPDMQRIHQSPPQPPEGAERREVDPAHLPPDDPDAYALMRRQVRVESALDREFDRLERRQQAATDEVELDHIRKLRERLLQLDDLYERLEGADSAEDRAQVQAEMQGLMGEVIRLSRTDRNHRMAEYARALGIRDTDEIVRFMEDVEGIFRETDTDWSRLFQQGR